MIEIVASIPIGSVLTYGDVATLAGTPRAARAVGNVLRTHAGAARLPWQRVINAQGRISFKGDVERATLQRALLEAEGVRFAGEKLDLARVRWDCEGAPRYFEREIPDYGVPSDWRDEG